MSAQASGNLAAAGFSLLELLVVAIIIAIVTCYAVPTYQQYLIATRRQQAEQTLMQTALALESYQQEYGKYQGANWEKLQINPNQLMPFYRLKLNCPGQYQYVISANPTNKQQDTLCGALTLNQAGARSYHGKASNISSCWPT